MQSPSRRAPLLRGLAVGLGGCLLRVAAVVTGPVRAQSAEQLQMLQSMPAAQREALMRQAGVGKAAGGATTGAAANQILVSRPAGSAVDDVE